MQHRNKPETGLQCRCGLIIPRDQLVDYLCPECRLARILNEYDRPSPDRVQMTFPGRRNGLFSTQGHRREP
jgi:hypothetical protein